MNYFSVINALFLVYKFQESSFVSCDLIPAEVSDVSDRAKNEKSVDGFRFDSRDSYYNEEETGTTGGEYYKLTNSDLFDIPEDILGHSLHIGSPHYGVDSGDEDELVIVPSPYYDDTPEDLDTIEMEIEREQEEWLYDSEKFDAENDITNLNDNKIYKLDDDVKEYSQSSPRESSNISITNNNYFEHVIKNEAHFIEKMNADKIPEKRLEPLFLTPFAYSSYYLIGQSLAAVKPFVGDVRSYSGYLTVDARFHSNLFFWYFPCERPDAKARPVLLWLQGGPGASSLFGLFYENGPYKLENGKIHRNQDTWTTAYNVLYIDNPVGTGFSFTTPQGYARNQTIIGKHMYEGLKQFFHLFPELRDNDFYITGESYAGKYIPSAALEIHKQNLMSHFKINLKGLFIGNGLIDPLSMLSYSEYLFHLGLLDEPQRELFAREEEKIKVHIQQRQWRRAGDTFENLFFSSRANTTKGPNFAGITGFHQHYNLNGLDFNTREFRPFLNDVSVRERLHVGYLKFNDGAGVGEALVADLMKSVLDKVNILVENYRVVLYYGQLDIICPYRVSEPFFSNIEFRHAYEYHRAGRQVWRRERQDGEDDVVGYIREAHNLVEVLVRNAGHMVPRDQPRLMMDLLRKYIGS